MNKDQLARHARRLGLGNDGQKGDQEKAASRVVIEFAGLDSATIKSFVFENVTMGQVLVLAEWAKLQAEMVLGQLAKQQRPASKSQPQIVVPNLRVQ